MNRDIKKLNRILDELCELTKKSKVVGGHIEVDSILYEKHFSNENQYKDIEVIGQEITIEIKYYF